MIKCTSHSCAKRRKCRYALYAGILKKGENENAEKKKSKYARVYDGDFDAA